MRLVGLALLILGVLAVVYGGFWYEKEEEAARIGPVKIEVEKRERVNVPLWAGVAGVVGGAILVATGAKRVA